MADERDVGRSVGLAAAIRGLRKELQEAHGEGADQDLQFRVGQVDLEFQVQISREASGEAGVKFYVVSLGGKASTLNHDTHTVRLTLMPQVSVGDEPQDLLVSDKVVHRPPLPPSR